MFARLRLHFEPTAFEKAWRSRCAVAARGACRPLLVERILRNLVSNAIRYTNDGGVLVSARARRQVILQVWDSAGIREPRSRRGLRRVLPAQHAGGGAAPAQGLGLGLAIVAPGRPDGRAAHAALAPGHGTVFTLELPAGTRPRPRCRRCLPGGVPGSRSPAAASWWWTSPRCARPGGAAAGLGARA